MTAVDILSVVMISRALRCVIYVSLIAIFVATRTSAKELVEVVPQIAYVSELSHVSVGIKSAFLIVLC